MRFFECAGHVYLDSGDARPCSYCREITREDYLFEIGRVAAAEIADVRRTLAARVAEALA